MNTRVVRAIASLVVVLAAGCTGGRSDTTATSAQDRRRGDAAATSAAPTPADKTEAPTLAEGTIVARLIGGTITRIESGCIGFVSDSDEWEGEALAFLVYWGDWKVDGNKLVNSAGNEITAGEQIVAGGGPYSAKDLNGNRIPQTQIDDCASLIEPDPQPSGDPVLVLLQLDR